MVEYFVINYAHLEHGYIFLTANYFISAGAVFALTDFKKPIDSARARRDSDLHLHGVPGILRKEAGERLR